MTSSQKIEAIKEEMSKVLVGQSSLVDSLIVALLTKGHILLEGVPGLAKTTAISALSQILSLDFKRIQFTPDLLPSDITGSRIYNPKDHSFSTRKGPLFANFILADEINRSPAKVQSALLEAMQEKQITIGDETYKLDSPFFVMATQNPVEQEGTFQLPEAQVDRFLLKAIITYPTKEEELEIMEKNQDQNPQKIKSILKASDIKSMQKEVSEIYADDNIKKYISDIIFASRFPSDYNLESIQDLLSFGASPRASIGLLAASKAVALMNQRDHVLPDDVKQIAPDILRHRIIPSYEAEAEGIDSDAIIKTILETVKVP